MLQQTNAREVQTAGAHQTKSFSIANNGKGFKLLIDGLYSDKIRAVVREISANAFDAHIAVGKKHEPFSVQLPTVFEPIFSVRDFGCSLSHDDVMGLYTTVFQSSKDGTNSQVGKFGLGSKSPFAYTDTFTVTTWFEGMKRMYSAYIGKDYVPMISLMAEEESDEERGLEVSFPVKTGDCDAFYTAMQKVSLGFKVKPTMRGRQCKFVELESHMEDSDGLWQLCSATEGYFNTGTAYARQGCIVYPIDAGAIPGITETQEAVLRSPFFIEFPIGDLEITGSRESLGYDAPTCKNVLAAVDLIIEEVRARHVQKFNECTTYWEACKALHELQESNLHSALKSVLSEGMKFGARTLVQTINMSTFLNHPAIKAGNVHMTHYSPSMARRKRAMKWEPSTYMTINPMTDGVYLDDVTKHKTHAEGKIRYHFDTHRNLYSSLVWVKADPKSLAWKRIYAAMGRPELIDVTALPKPPVDKDGYVKRPVKLKALDKRYGSKWEKTDVVESDDIVYVELDRDSIHAAGSTEKQNYWASVHAVKEVAAILAKHNLIPSTTIIGVPKSCARFVRRNAHWRSLWKVAQAAVDANFDPVRAARAETCASVSNEGAFMVVKEYIEAGLKPADPKGWMGKMITVYEKVKFRADEAKEQREWYGLANKLAVGHDMVKLPRYHVAWEPLANKVRDTYPMIEHIGYINSAKIYDVHAYVNLVDKA